MGGTGSGRHGGGPTVDSARSLNINEMVRSGMIRRGGDRRCSVTWTHHNTGELTHELVVEGLLSDPARPHLRLLHLHEGKILNAYNVWLTSTPQRLGGERLWFRCPVTGERVATLHMPLGADHFASREAFRLTYRSQRSSPHDRACARMHKMRRALGAEPGNLRRIEKPHRMHWTTFNAKLARLQMAEARAVGFLVPAVEALQRRMIRNAVRTRRVV